MSFTAADDSESFSSFSEDEDNSQFVHGLSHVRRLEQENENCLSNLSKELKLLSEPASKRRKIDKESLTESFMEILPRKCGKSAVKRTKNNLFQNLSDEVIVKIFSYLNRQSLGRTASVCQRFRRIAYDESLWKRIKMYNKNVSFGVVGQVLARGSCYLSLAKATLQSPLISTELKKSKLKYLDMSACSLTMEDLETLTQTCTVLEKISLEKIANISLQVCKNLVQSKMTLTVLNLCDCSQLDSEGIKKIVANCQELKELNLAFTNLQHSDIEFICNNLSPQLHKLNLAGLRGQIKNQNVQSLVNNCPDLLELDLSDASTLTGESLDFIVRLSKLRRLSLSRCFDIHPATLLKLSLMKQLKYLNVFGILKEEKFGILRRELPQLIINDSPLSFVGRSAGVKNLLWDVKLWQ